MWCLPSLEKLNNDAVKRIREEKGKTVKQICRGEKCETCGKKATSYEDCYDAFGDVAKGHIFYCADHVGETPEGYFRCDACGKLMIKNYTWENYFTETDEGTVCLNCALDRAIEDKDNWLGKKEVDALTFEQVKKCKHLIPVEGKHWQHELEFIKNIELDSSTGGRLTGFSTSEDSPDGGLRELKEICYEALEDYDKVILILDGTYQFSISIGIYSLRDSKNKRKSSQLTIGSAVA